MADINLALTMAGQILKAKIEMGKGNIPLEITRIVTASGTSDDPLNLVSVVDLKQAFTITNRVTTGARTSITCMLSNYGDPDNGILPLATGYPLTQIGFYAIDPDEGEILYRISQFDSPNYVPATKERGWTFEPTFNFVTGNASEVTVQIDPSGFATAQDLINHDDSTTAHPLLQQGINRLYKLFKLTPLEDADYGDSYFNIMPIDGGRLDEDLSAVMGIDGETYDVSYDENKLIDAGGFDAEYFGVEAGISVISIGANSVLDGGTY